MIFIITIEILNYIVIMKFRNKHASINIIIIFFFFFWLNNIMIFMSQLLIIFGALVLSHPAIHVKYQVSIIGGSNGG